MKKKTKVAKQQNGNSTPIPELEPVAKLTTLTLRPICRQITEDIELCANYCWDRLIEIFPNSSESDFIEAVKEAEFVFKSLRKRNRYEYYCVISKKIRSLISGNDKDYWRNKLGLTKVGWFYFRKRILHYYSKGN